MHYYEIHSKDEVYQNMKNNKDDMYKNMAKFVRYMSGSVCTRITQYLICQTCTHCTLNECSVFSRFAMIYLRGVQHKWGFKMSGVMFVFIITCTLYYYTVTVQFEKVLSHNRKHVKVHIVENRTHDSMRSHCYRNYSRQYSDSIL